MLAKDYVPDRHEEPFGTEEQAWEYARLLAMATKGRFVNFYVTHAASHSPVAGYRERMITNR